jgi:hypothetical protein
LLIRGRAELDAVDGIPDEFLEAASTYEMSPEQRVEWEAEVRSLSHDGMVRIVVTPTWAKLIDFETTLPIAVEELARQREEGAARLRAHAVKMARAPSAARTCTRRSSPRMTRLGAAFAPPAPFVASRERLPTSSDGTYHFEKPTSEILQFVLWRLVCSRLSRKNQGVMSNMQDDLDTLVMRARRARALQDTVASTQAGMLIELELLRLREPAPPAVDRFLDSAYEALAERERESHGGLREAS